MIKTNQYKELVQRGQNLLKQGSESVERGHDFLNDGMNQYKESVQRGHDLQKQGNKSVQRGRDLQK